MAGAWEFRNDLNAIRTGKPRLTVAHPLEFREEHDGSIDLVCGTLTVRSQSQYLFASNEPKELFPKGLCPTEIPGAIRKCVSSFVGTTPGTTSGAEYFNNRYDHWAIPLALNEHILKRSEGTFPRVSSLRLGLSNIGRPILS
jgi:hypothetical protein